MPFWPLVSTLSGWLAAVLQAADSRWYCSPRSCERTAIENSIEPGLAAAACPAARTCRRSSGRSPGTNAVAERGHARVGVLAGKDQGAVAAHGQPIAAGDAPGGAPEGERPTTIVATHKWVPVRRLWASTAGTLMACVPSVAIVDREVVDRILEGQRVRARAAQGVAHRGGSPCRG